MGSVFISLPAGGEREHLSDGPLPEIDRSSAGKTLDLLMVVLSECDLELVSGSKRKDPLIYAWFALRVNWAFFSVISSC